MSFYPSFPFVLQAQKTHAMLPICYKVWSDQMTPIRLFQRLKGTYSFLLESMEGGEKWARYSFVGNQPELLFTVLNGKVVLKHLPEEREEEVEGEPLAILKELLRQYQAPHLEGVPRFSGGAVGYVGYDAIRLVEDIPKHLVQDGFPEDIRLMFCSEMIAFDHVQQEIIFMSHLRLDSSFSEEELRAEYERVCQKLLVRVSSILDQGEQGELQFFQLPSSTPQVDWERVQSNMEKTQYLERIERIKEYIRAGEVAQTVFSQRFSADLKTAPFDVYRVLRTINPSPYMYYLDLGAGLTLVGSSPERLVQVEGRKVETNPIAGTRKRGHSEAEDMRLAEELLGDQKEKAEHHMLLELGCSDIQRVAEQDTVRISKLMEIERFSHVMHIVSTVEGVLREELDAVDALFSCFPAGTVSGAPRVRAMEIIAELEQDARNVYAGAVGYFSYTGHLDTCIAIRTMIAYQGKAYVQAGGGIVADSIAELEWEESRNKASALLVAIQLAEQLFAKQEKSEKEERAHV